MARKPLIPAGSYLPAEATDTQNDGGLLGRIVQNDAVKHGRRPEMEQESSSQVSEYDLSYGNMTCHIAGHKEDHAENQQEDKPVRKQARSQTRQPESLPVVQPALQSPSQPSIRSVIQATIQRSSQAPEVLKTVTIKLAPSLDRTVETHCFETGRKKQDVVRDALLLYFEAIAEAAGEGEEE